MINYVANLALSTPIKPENEDLYACPFCGSRFVFISHDNHDMYYVYCDMCSAKGPTRISEDTAIKDWNKRNFFPYSFY